MSAAVHPAARPGFKYAVSVSAPDEGEAKQEQKNEANKLVRAHSWARENTRRTTLTRMKSKRIEKQEEIARQKSHQRTQGLMNSAVKELRVTGQRSALGQFCIVRAGGTFRTTWDTVMFVLLVFIGLFTPCVATPKATRRFAPNGDESLLKGSPAVDCCAANTATGTSSPSCRICHGAPSMSGSRCLSGSSSSPSSFSLTSS